MNILKKISLPNLVKKPSRKLTIALVVAATLPLAVLGAGYVQAARTAGEVDRLASESTNNIFLAVESATKSINNDKTDLNTAIAELENLSSEARNQADKCDEAGTAFAGFLSSSYKSSRDSCQQYSRDALALADSIDTFASHARFMSKLQSALGPALAAAPSGTASDPGKIAAAWQKADRNLGKIEAIPSEAENALSQVRAAAKQITKQAKAVQTAQQNRDVAAFDKANKTLAGQYAKLNEAGGKLQAWLVTEQDRLLESATPFTD